MSESLRMRIARLIGGREVAERLASVSVRVDDAVGWQSYAAGQHDRDLADLQDLYANALTAWRKNPLAKRIVDITTDYVVGDGVTLEAPGEIGRFLDLWWEHPENRMDLRLPDLVDEMSRAGNLFLTLHRNPQDGMSYVRPVPADKIQRIETAPQDWEKELAFFETMATGEPRRWLASVHPDAAGQPAVMVHYAINRPTGALMGEGDLATLIPWLLRYSRMLEDRVRLNWAMRAFLWIVTVPSHLVREKSEKYRTPPEPGSVVVKDSGETWEPVAPDLHATDARHDMAAVRRMIQAGSYPPHWMGEPEESNLATAEAMNDPAVRHLRRRQLYVRWMLLDLAHTAYSRAFEVGRVRKAPKRETITVEMPDISREDNTALATAAQSLSTALGQVRREMSAGRPVFDRWMLSQVARFAGETLEDSDLDDMIQEVKTAAALAPAVLPGVGGQPDGGKPAPGEQPGEQPAEQGDGGGER